jgi:3-hydroxy-3-methylglutaryl CoA synthase
MTFARSRLLKKPLPMSADNIEVVSLASNGRKGRRIACLSMGDGREMQVFDMSVDDDEDEDEDDDDDDDEEEAEAEESTMQHSAGEEEGLDRGEVEDGSRMEIDEDEGL